MSLPVKIVISIVIALVAANATSYLQGNALPDLVLSAAFCIATIATVLLTGTSAAQTSHASGEQRDSAVAHSASASGPREEGNVKWFNVSKGFGFITLDNDEEIFVHFRSIRGEGRRSLRDGQRVSFVVAESDKGPQAEDVEALD